MKSIRDEISKVVDVRIPPNGYRSYIKTISRDGGFQDLQRDNCLIALFEVVEELQKEVVDLRQQLDLQSQSVVKVPVSATLEEVGKLASDALAIKRDQDNTTTCACGFTAKNNFGLKSHIRFKHAAPHKA